MRDINATSLKQLHYEANYDHVAALQLAHSYLFSKELSRDKYKAFTYYELYKQLSRIHPKPLTSSESNSLANKIVQVESQLKASLHLDDNLKKTSKTTLRQIASTQKYRSIYGWFMAIRRTLSEVNNFLLKINITGLSQVVNRIPFLGLILPIFDIGFELGIVTKISLKRAYEDYQQGQGISPKNVAQEAKNSLKKDGRMPRIFFTGMWLTIGIISMLVVAAAAPLLVFGMTVELLLQFARGAISLSNLTKERQFIENELEACKQQLANHRSGTAPVCLEEYNWLYCKQSRLDLRLKQLEIARSLEKAKIISNVTITSIILLGAGLLLIPTPVTSALGLFIIAAGTVGYLSLKLINTVIKNNYKTELAIPASEYNQPLTNTDILAASALTNERAAVISPDQILGSLGTTLQTESPIAPITIDSSHRLQDNDAADQQPSRVSKQLVTLSIFYNPEESERGPADNSVEKHSADNEPRPITHQKPL